MCDCVSVLFDNMEEGRVKLGKRLVEEEVQEHDTYLIKTNSNIYNT